MHKTLKEKTAHGILWSFVDRFGQQVFYITVGIILTRYFLNPTDYGLYGLVVVFNLLGCVLVDSGFSNALIRKHDTTQTDLSSVFYVNMGIGLLLYLIIFFCAPLYASFFGQPALTSLIRIISLVVPLSALSIIHTVLLSKSINFRFLARINLIAIFCAGAISLFLAFKGLGVWVLVIQPVSIIVIRNIGLWSLSSWRPKAIFDIQSIKNLWKYSYKLLASSLLTTFFDNLNTMVLARFYPIQAIGFVERGKKYADIPYVTVSAVQGVTFPALVHAANDAEQLKRAFRKTIRVMSFLFIPIMMGFVAIAEPLVHTILGERWLPIVPYLRIISVGYIFLGVSALFVNILFIKGNSSGILKFNLFYRALLLLGIIFTVRIGIIPLLITYSSIGIFYSILLALYAGRKIGYNFFEQIKDIMPYFILALFMSVGVFVFSFFIENRGILLLTQLIVGASFYLGTTYLLGSKVFMEVVEMVRSRISKM